MVWRSFKRPALIASFFFDNLQYLMVLLVVVLHMACGFSNDTEWWAVNDNNAVVFDHILRILGIFLMPMLFFIAFPCLDLWFVK